MKSFKVRINMDNGEQHNLLLERRTSKEAYSYVAEEQENWLEYAQGEKVLYIQKDKISSFEVVDSSWELDEIGKKQAKQLEAILKMNS